MPKRHVQAAIALIERRGRYLVCRRRAGDFLGGFWEFPGGKREPGERWTVCLRRELREELGVAVKSVRPFGTIRHRGPHGSIMFKVFRCAIARGEPRPVEADTLRWVPARELTRYRFPPANRRLIARLSAAPLRRRPARGAVSSAVL